MLQLFAESFAEILQSGFVRQTRIGFLHSVHEVLYRPAVAKDLLHFLQIADLELYCIGFYCPAVSADEQYRTGFQGLLCFRDFSVDGCRSLLHGSQ